MKTESVICEQCGESFDKLSKEVKRSISLGRKQYCSRSCAGKSVSNIQHLIKINPLDASHLNAYNRRDEFTGFRVHLRRLNNRNKKVDLTLQDLKSVFESQNGICPYSGVKLIFAPSSGKSNPIYTMSIDRKDSSLDYTKNNIQFTSIAMNHLKNNMTEEQMQEMLAVLKK